MQTIQSLKIILADDHEVVRSGVKLIAGQRDDLDIVSEASSYYDLLDLLEEVHCDILFLDLNLGDKNGIHSIREISDKYQDISIIVLSMFPEDPYALQSIQSGAKGYVSKKSISEELFNAIDHVKKGKVYLNPEYLDTLPYGTELKKTNQASIKSLSKREYEVYLLFASGLSSKGIAEELDVSPKTVSTYRTRILNKLSLANTTQLIQYATQHDF